MNNSSIGGIDVGGSSLKRELTLTVVSALVTIAAQAIADNVSAWIQHKRETKKEKEENEQNALLEASQHEMSEEDMLKMEEEATEKLRTMISEEVTSALHTFHKKTTSSNKGSKRMKKVVRSNKGNKKENVNE